MLEWGFSVEINQITPKPPEMALADAQKPQELSLAPEGPLAPSAPANASQSLLGANPTPFPDCDPPPASVPCSFNECLNGHRWPAALAVATCPGCTGQVLAIQKTQCPFCNEPITTTNLRSDFLVRGAQVASRCKGAPIQGESLDIGMTRHGWKAAEASYEPFLAREAKERKVQ